MKHVITIVGTSLFSNYLKKNESSDRFLRDRYEKYMHKPESEYQYIDTEKNKIKNRLYNFLEEGGRVSAEIRSLEKIRSEMKDEVTVHLLASDTINSRICAEVIQAFLKEVEKNKYVDALFSEGYVIRGLQVKNRKQFLETGMSNLFKIIEGIGNRFYRNIVINITGGYKAAIPMLTIFSQINKIPSYYIFEDTEELMKIPLLPLSIDWEIFDKYASLFAEIADSGGGVDNWNKLAKNVRWEHKEAVFSCFDIAGNCADISTFGEILWEIYKGRRFLFYVSSIAKEELRQDQNYKSYLSKLFYEEIRAAKTENKNGHLVLDLGTSAPRIFYNLRNQTIYVYRYMRHNQEYERFLKSTPFRELDDFGPYQVEILKKT